ncbi:MAG: hypothetical protein RXO24_09575, partial [Acidilobus sp.]
SSSASRQELALKYVLTPRLKPTVIGSVPYLLIDDYISASVASKTHDYRDKTYYTATVNAAVASEKAVINSLSGLQLAPGFNFYADSLSSVVKEMITRAFKTRYPDLPLPKLEKYEEKGAFEELASLIFGKLLNELGKHYDRVSIEAMAKLAAAELLLQVYIKFFEDLGVIKVLS